MNKNILVLALAFGLSGCQSYNNLADSYNGLTGNVNNKLNQLSTNMMHGGQPSLSNEQVTVKASDVPDDFAVKLHFLLTGEVAPQAYTYHLQGKLKYTNACPVLRFNAHLFNHDVEVLNAPVEVRNSPANVEGIIDLYVSAKHSSHQYQSASEAAVMASQEGADVASFNLKISSDIANAVQHHVPYQYQPQDNERKIVVSNFHCDQSDSVSPNINAQMPIHSNQLNKSAISPIAAQALSCNWKESRNCPYSNEMYKKDKVFKKNLNAALLQANIHNKYATDGLFLPVIATRLQGQPAIFLMFTSSPDIANQTGDQGAFEILFFPQTGRVLGKYIKDNINLTGGFQNFGSPTPEELVLIDKLQQSESQN